MVRILCFNAGEEEEMLRTYLREQGERRTTTFLVAAEAEMAFEDRSST